MASLAQVATAMQDVLTTVADQAARETGFIQRVRKWTGAIFVQTLVLGWLSNPAASLSELTQVAAKRGISVSPQGLAQRFGKAAADLLERVLSAAIEQVIAAEPVAVPLLQRFTGVFILDSSTIRLPDGLAEVWAGCGGRVARGTRAALKLAVRLDLCTGPGAARIGPAPCSMPPCRPAPCAWPTWASGAWRSSAASGRRGRSGSRASTCR